VLEKAGIRVVGYSPFFSPPLSIAVRTDHSLKMEPLDKVVIHINPARQLPPSPPSAPTPSKKDPLLLHVHLVLSSFDQSFFFLCLLWPLFREEIPFAPSLPGIL